MPARDNQAMGAGLRDAVWSGPRPLGLDPVRPIELFDAWLFAENDATVALGTWFAAPSDRRADAYAAYVAALDREAQGAEVLRRRLTTG
jgi:hypothetical protein